MRLLELAGLASIISFPIPSSLSGTNTGTGNSRDGIFCFLRSTYFPVFMGHEMTLISRMSATTFTKIFINQLAFCSWANWHPSKLNVANRMLSCFDSTWILMWMSSMSWNRFNVTSPKCEVFDGIVILRTFWSNATWNSVSNNFLFYLERNFITYSFWLLN